MNKIYHLSLLLGAHDHDRYDRLQEVILIAADEQRARVMAREKSGELNTLGSPDDWLSPASASCVELTPEGSERIVLIDGNPS